MTDTSFTSLGLTARTLSAIETAGYTVPTEVQARAIPILSSGRDVLATAQTGTGKTAAFVLPMLERLFESRPQGRTKQSGPAKPRALIVTPTRELAVQVHENVIVYGKGSGVSAVAIYGGASKNKQATQLSRFPEVLVATPGRLLDFMAEGAIDLSLVSYLVLDEADRMLDMGFIPDVRRIVAKVSHKRQTALFSATMPTEIAKLADELLHEPERIDAQRGELRVKAIEQSVVHVPQGDKLALLHDLIQDRGMYKVLVFTRTKHRARKVAKVLGNRSLICDSIHGDKSQGARNRALEAFKSGKTRVLVATDVASRGIDVDDVTHVVNFELPNEAETYVHRIGRTARAGADGVAISLCDTAELGHLRGIEKLIGSKLKIDRSLGYDAPRPEPRMDPKNRMDPKKRRGRR